MAHYRTCEKSGLIGLSLSLCISEMVRESIGEDDVQKIIAATNAPTLKDFQEILDRYAETYWEEYPEEAKALAASMMVHGKIEQPRTEGKPYPYIYNGKWVDSEEDIDWE
jgi:hypothetical protein